MRCTAVTKGRTAMVPAISGYIKSHIIKSSHYIILEVSLGVTILMSVLLVACNNVRAAETTEIREWKESLERQPQIVVGHNPSDIEINEDANKIYVASRGSNSVSIIDGTSGTLKNIGVGSGPVSIAIDEASGKVYVALSLKISSDPEMKRSSLRNLAWEKSAI